MGHDPIQCTRAYLNLWKIADRLFPESRWLEVGEIPDSELQTNAQALSTGTLSWCDTPDELQGYAKKVLALRIDEGSLAEADKLRSKLMDRALSYAEQIKPDTSERPHTFMWAADSSTTPRFEAPTDLHKMAEQSLEQAKNAIHGYLQFIQRAVPGDVAGGPELTNKILGYAERNLASAFEFAQRLVQAKDVKEIANLQMENIKAQMQAMTEQARDLSDTAMNTLMESTKTSTKGSLFS